MDTLHDYVERLFEEKANQLMLLATERDRQYEQRYEASRETAEATKESLETLINERDKQYWLQMNASREGLSRLSIAHAETATAQEGLSAALAAANEAVNKAQAATEKRFEGVNEFREQLAEQALTFARRDELTLQMTAVADKIEGEAKRAMGVSGSLNDKIDRLTDRVNTNTGGIQKSSQIIIYLIGILGPLVSVITLIVLSFHK